MWTLLNQSGTLTCGIFETEEDAIDWSERFLPSLGLIPVELLISKEMKMNITITTWEGQAHTFPTPLSIN